VSDPHQYHADPDSWFEILADLYPGLAIFADSDPGLDFFSPKNSLLYVKEGKKEL